MLEAGRFLLHLTPNLYGNHQKVDLLDFSIDSLGLHLQGGKDLAVRKPFPNKQHHIACRAIGRSAVHGIFLDLPSRPTSLLTKARWSIDATVVCTHLIEVRLLDQELDAATQDPIIWYGTSASLGSWSSRMPEQYTSLAPVDFKPWMEVQPAPEYERKLKKTRSYQDVRDGRGFVVERQEVYEIPTVEAARLITPGGHLRRMPSFSSAWRI